MLEFSALRRVNCQRLQLFPGHTDTWSANDWMVAVTGEVGELANKLKRIRRGVVIRDKAIPSTEELAEEIADIVIYLDLLAAHLHIDMAHAVIEKFNRVSLEIDPDRMPLL